MVYIPANKLESFLKAGNRLKIWSLSIKNKSKGITMVNMLFFAIFILTMLYLILL